MSFVPDFSQMIGKEKVQFSGTSHVPFCRIIPVRFTTIGLVTVALKGAGRRRKYLKFLEEGTRIGRRPELVGGGLIRSAEGWSGVLALRRRGERSSSDERILGDGEFVEKIIEEWDEVGRANLRLTQVRKSLLLLAQQVCEHWRVTQEELRSGSRRQVVFKAREEFAQMAVKGLGYSGAEVARYIGVTGSCVTRVVAEQQLSEEVKTKYQNL
jgi:hypothetical protein